MPCQDASARNNRLGHITREGPAIVRWLLTEAAWQGVRRSPLIRTFYERVRREDPERRKIALVATAHYLLRAMMAMLRTGEVWRSSPRRLRLELEKNDAGALLSAAARSSVGKERRSWKVRRLRERNRTPVNGHGEGRPSR